MQLSLVSTYHPCRETSGGCEVSGFFLLLGFCSETQQGINSIIAKTFLPRRLISAWQLLQGVPARSPLVGSQSGVAHSLQDQSNHEINHLNSRRCPERTSTAPKGTQQKQV